MLARHFQGIVAFLTTLFAGSFALTGCTGQQADPWAGATDPRVATTFAPLHCFALNVLGPNGSVRSLLTTQGPHHADPPTSQAKMLSRAGIFFSNGLGVDDSIVRKMKEAMGHTGLVGVKLGDEIPKDLLLVGTCACCQHNEGQHDHNHDDLDYDGHVWLGIDQARAMTNRMAETISRTFYSNPNEPKLKEQDDLKKNAEAFSARLDKLHADGKALLKDKQNRAILPFHGSLAYFAKSFDLKLVGPIQDVPGKEPTAKQLDEIVKQCVEKQVRVIAVEPQYGADTSAKVIFDALKAKGLDPEIVVIDPLETATDGEMNAGWYERKMRANLEALAMALR